jgi:hypothetical protein
MALSASLTATPVTDTNLLLLAAAALIAVLLLPVSNAVRTALFVIVIGAVTCWELATGLNDAVGWFN